MVNFSARFVVESAVSAITFDRLASQARSAAAKKRLSNRNIISIEVPLFVFGMVIKQATGL